MFSVQFLMMNLIIISKKDKMKNKMMFWDPKKTKNTKMRRNGHFYTTDSLFSNAYGALMAKIWYRVEGRMQGYES